MKLRKLLLAGLALGVLGGCAAYPYDDPNYYSQQPYYSDYYGPRYYGGPAYYGAPGYYVAPSIGFGITYSDRHYYGHRHRH